MIDEGDDVVITDLGGGNALVKAPNGKEIFLSRATIIRLNLLAEEAPEVLT